ncbi:MAG: fluoride efflux transporter CrcB [Pseudomonadota bacterium]
MTTLYTYLAVAGGGAIGACLRLFIQHQALNILGKSFPFGTLAVNVLGSFLIGLIYAYFQQQEIQNPHLKAFVTVGILGALTTFSTFSLDTILLVQEGNVAGALLNVFLNVVLCIGCVWLALLILEGQ